MLRHRHIDRLCIAVMALALALHPGSLDGRYLGLVPLASLRRAEPLAAF